MRKHKNNKYHNMNLIQLNNLLVNNNKNFKF